MLRVVLRFFDEREIDASVAWYEPWSLTPSLSVPLWRSAFSRVGSERRDVSRDPDRPKEGGAVPGYALGAWAPELEFTHYRATDAWKGLISEHDFHVVVSGTAMAGRAFAETGTRFLAWVASDWHGDRKDRVRKFPSHRRLLDRVVVRPITRRLERRILRAGRILALSKATRRELDRAAGSPVVADILPFPIDSDLFRPDSEVVVPGRIGFVGRFDDPRKNLELFLDALAVARRTDGRVRGHVVGGRPNRLQIESVDRRGLREAVEFVPYCPPSELAKILATFDVLAVTAHQEGLGIATLEAMSAGVPIVSTRCGGPEEYVESGLNGELTDFDPSSIAGSWLSILSDPAKRARYSAKCRETIADGYSIGRAHDILRENLGYAESSKGG